VISIPPNAFINFSLFLGGCTRMKLVSSISGSTSARCQIVCRARDQVDTAMTLDTLMGERRPSFAKPIYTDLTHLELARIIQRRHGSTGS
jgi:hypothetical protein